MSEDTEDDIDEVTEEERARRRASIARARAGVVPAVRAEDVTYDDEPADPVRVPLRAALFRPPDGASVSFDTAMVDVGSLRRGIAQERASEAWQAETAAEPLEQAPAQAPAPPDTTDAHAALPAVLI